MEKLYIVKYSGPFGFIKPWTAVRDEKTFSQQFLTPSIVEGIEKKLFPELLGTVGLQEKIVGHRLNYTGISQQQEQTWSRAWKKTTETVTEKRLVPPKKGLLFDDPVFKDVKVKLVNERPATGILNRCVLLEPNLFLAFASLQHAKRASEQHICLCRNEDVLLPDDEVLVLSDTDWAEVEGFELQFCSNKEQAFRVGYNRFANAEPMYGRLISVGDPIRKSEFE
jgi:hypothetical protein